MTSWKMDRRKFVKLCVLGATGLGAGMVTSCGGKKEEERPTGQVSRQAMEWPLGIQSYSLRGYGVLEAINRARELGLGYIEIFPGHFPPDSPREKVEELRKTLQAAGVIFNAYGVVGFGPDEAKGRLYFEFAKKMGIGYLSADPEPTDETMGLLDRLVSEYDVKIAIHNHGPKSRYSTVEDVLRVVENRHPNIGACVDTGHFLRSEVDPVEAIRRLGKRVHGVHLKDWAGVEGEWPVFGEGKLDIVGVFGALKEIGFSGFISIEYEAHPDNPMEYLKKCVQATRDAIAKASG